MLSCFQTLTESLTSVGFGVFEWPFQGVAPDIAYKVI